MGTQNQLHILFLIPGITHGASLWRVWFMLQWEIKIKINLL